MNRAMIRHRQNTHENDHKKAKKLGAKALNIMASSI